MTVAAAALAACEPGPGAVDVDIAPMLDRQAAEMGEAGAYPADIQIPVSADAAQATLRVLPNDTALAGDNYIQVIPPRGFGGRMSLDATLRQLGPLSSPFDFALSSDFRQAGGYGADFAVLERRPEEGVTCILAIGSAGGLSARPNSVVMRNCVKGDASQALAPLASYDAY